MKALGNLSILNGISAVASQLGGVTGYITGANSVGVRSAAVLLVGAIRETLSSPGRGRTYRIPVTPRVAGAARGGVGGGARYRFHRASAPGDAPAVMYGDLRRSITFGVVGGRMRVGTQLAKAPFLENGAGSLAKRPFMAPSVDRVRDAMTDLMVDVHRDGL